jgi:hypothetical protein
VRDEKAAAADVVAAMIFRDERISFHDAVKAPARQRLWLTRCCRVRALLPLAGDRHYRDATRGP